MLLRLPPARRRHGVRPPGLAVALLGLAAFLMTAGCQPPPDQSSPEILLVWAVTPDPPVAGPATLSLTLSENPAGTPVEGAEVRLEGNMSHPGMKPVLGTAREVTPGQYEAPFEFTMGGDWFILVNATLRDGRTLQRRLDLEGVRSR